MKLTKKLVTIGLLTFSTLSFSMTSFAYTTDDVIPAIESEIPDFAGIVEDVDIDETAASDSKEELEAEKEEENSSAINTPNGVLIGNFKLTAYCPGSCCNGKWAGKPTAMGTKLTPGRTIAVDPKVIPLGSRVAINIDGEWREFIAEDTGGAIKGNRIDVCMARHSDCHTSDYNRVAPVMILN